MSFFPILFFLVTFFHIPAFFYRKPKWSVWSLWTYSTGWILKFVIEKVSYGRKLKIEDFEKLKMSVWGSKIDFWGCFQDQNDFWKYSGPFRNHPGSISIYKNIIFNEISPKSRKIDKNRYFYIKSLTSIPFGGPTGNHTTLQILGNAQFFPNGHVSNFQKC